MKKSLYFLLFLITTLLNAKVMEIPFNTENQENFYLYNTEIFDEKVLLRTGDVEYRKIADSIFIPFEMELNFENNITLFQDAVFGKKSGLFYDANNYIRFKYENTFDFGLVLEFWLKPFSVESGTIFSTEYLPLDGINRSFEVYYKKGKIHFLLQNLFIDESVPPKLKTLKLSSDKQINQKEWHHHRLTYNPSNGELNYYLDGELNSQIWATKDKTPNSSIMYLETPKNWVYVIGKGYRGFMDNFFFSSDIKNIIPTTIYNTRTGLIQTRVLHFESLSSIYDIEVLSNMPKDTFTTLEYRVSREPFSNTTSEDIISWQEYNLVNYQYNQKIKTKYMQFRLKLFPSPDGQMSPKINAIRLKYNTIEIPAIPLGLSAYSSEEKIILSFRENINKNIVAYKIYYGKNKNEYWGKGAIKGDSPILVPITELERNIEEARYSYILKELEINSVYYFRITALSDDGLESEKSDEISVRVRKLK